MIFMVTGLFAAYYLGLKPGGTIVLVGVLFLLLVFAGKRLFRRIGSQLKQEAGLL